MRIYIFRHGEALSKSDPSVPNDADRPLIEDGIRKTRQACEGLKKCDVSLDAMFTSPWLRAKQTADIAAEVLGLTDVLFEMEELAGDRDVEDVMNALARQSQYEDVMLVGHNPQLGEIASYL